MILARTLLLDGIRRVCKCNISMCNEMKSKLTGNNLFAIIAMIQISLAPPVLNPKNKQIFHSNILDRSLLIRFLTAFIHIERNTSNTIFLLTGISFIFLLLCDYFIINKG